MNTNISQKLSSLAKSKTPKYKRLQRIEEWKKYAGIYGAILSTFLSIYACYEKFSPKKHDIEVFAADINSNSEYIEFTVAYYNAGGFNEVLSKAELFLAQKVKGYNAPIYWNAATCTEPLLIKSMETVYQTYKAKIDYTNKKYQSASVLKQEFYLYLGFDFISKELGRVHKRFPVASFDPYNHHNSEKKIANIRFITTKEKVDFDNARPVIIYSSYPKDLEFDEQNFCGKKI